MRQVQRFGFLDRLCLARLQVCQQRGTGVLRVIDEGELFDAGIQLLGREQFRSRAVRADRIILGRAIGGHHIGRHAHLVKAVAGADHTFGADVPFIHHGDQIGAFAQHAFKAGVVVRQPFNRIVCLFELWQNGAEPDRGSRDPVLLAQQIQDLCRGLSDGHGGLGCRVKAERVAAVVDGQRIVCLCAKRGAARKARNQGQAGKKWFHIKGSGWSDAGVFE